MVLIINKERKGKVGEYREVTLMPSIYKYAAVLAERLRVEMERRGLLSGNQTEFRKGMNDRPSICAKLIGKQATR